MILSEEQKMRMFASYCGAKVIYSNEFGRYSSVIDRYFFYHGTHLKKSKIILYPKDKVPEKSLFEIGKIIFKSIYDIDFTDCNHNNTGKNEDYVKNFGLDFFKTNLLLKPVVSQEVLDKCRELFIDVGFDKMESLIASGYGIDITKTKFYY